jgi:hypothetical protein
VATWGSDGLVTTAVGTVVRVATMVSRAVAALARPTAVEGKPATVERVVGRSAARAEWAVAASSRALVVARAAATTERVVATSPEAVGPTVVTMFAVGSTTNRVVVRRSGREEAEEGGVAVVRVRGE